jgi:hypothetical protein
MRRQPVSSCEVLEIDSLEFSSLCGLAVSWASETEMRSRAKGFRCLFHGL